MKIVSGALAAAFLVGLGWTMPAEAQGIPQGSYLRSCNGARLEGDTLIARCRTQDGRELRSSLPGVRRCAGDIGNIDGVLQCTAPGGGQARGEVVPDPGYRQPGYGGPQPGYGGPPPGYGDRRYGERGGGWERCRELRREAEELRYRLEREFNPIERARTEGRLREVHNQEERCR